MAAAMEAAPERIAETECSYAPNDAVSVAAFWSKAKVRLPRGKGWQTRMNDALREYVKQHGTS